MLRDCLKALEVIANNLNREAVVTPGRQPPSVSKNTTSSDNTLSDVIDTVNNDDPGMLPNNDDNNISIASIELLIPDDPTTSVHESLN